MVRQDNNSPPNWWGMPPAILKGWVDRVMRPGVAYEFLEGDSGEGVPCGAAQGKEGSRVHTSNTDAMRERRALEILYRGSGRTVSLVYAASLNSTEKCSQLWCSKLILCKDGSGWMKFRPQSTNISLELGGVRSNQRSPVKTSAMIHDWEL